MTSSISDPVYMYILYMYVACNIYGTSAQFPKILANKFINNNLSITYMYVYTTTHVKHVMCSSSNCVHMSHVNKMAARLADNDEKFLKKLEQELLCAVCQQEYMDPRTLPCIHTFCLECIKKVKQVNLNN